jgi:hypothetical protein
MPRQQSTAAKRARLVQGHARLPQQYTKLLHAENNALRRLSVALDRVGLREYALAVRDAIPPGDNACEYAYLRLVYDEAQSALSTADTPYQRYRLEQDLRTIDREMLPLYWGPDYWCRPVMDAVFAALHHTTQGALPDRPLLQAVHEVTEHWSLDLENMADTVRGDPYDLPGATIARSEAAANAHAALCALVEASRIGRAGPEGWERCQRYLFTVVWCTRQAFEAADGIQLPF